MKKINFNNNKQNANRIALGFFKNSYLWCSKRFSSTDKINGFVTGTFVLTNNGYKTIETITLDDFLLTQKGVFKKILKIQKNLYSGKVYEFNIRSLPNTIKCTEHQTFLVRTLQKNETFSSPTWKKASHLTIYDFWGMVINKSDILPVFVFEKGINKHKKILQNFNLDQKAQWWMLGYFFGDGWVTDTKRNGVCRNEINFAISFKDELEVVTNIQKVLPIADRKVNSGKSKRYGVSNSFWHKVLKTCGKYAHGKFIPEWVQDAPTTLLNEFFNGYHKADGSLSKSNQNLRNISTVSVSLAFGLQRLLFKLGYILSISKSSQKEGCVIKGKVVKRQPFIYKISGSLKPKQSVLSFIEKGPQDLGDFVWLNPLSAPTVITKISETNFYTFEVENDNNFVVENFLASCDSSNSEN